MKVDKQDTCVDEFTGATSKRPESSAPTIAKITKVLLWLKVRVNFRLGKAREGRSITSTTQMSLDRN